MALAALELPDVQTLLSLVGGFIGLLAGIAVLGDRVWGKRESKELRQETHQQSAQCAAQHISLEHTLAALTRSMERVADNQASLAQSQASLASALEKQMALAETRHDSVMRALDQRSP